MTETEMRVAIVLSGLMVLAGLGTAAWAIQTNAQRSFFAQGMYFIMFGLALLFMLALPVGVLRTTMAGTFVLGAIGWALAQFTFLRRERRTRREGAQQKPGQ